MTRTDRFEDKGKVKFRFIEFEMEGGSANLEQTLKSIAGAIASPQRPVVQPRVLTAAPAAGIQRKGGAPIEVEPLDDVPHETEESVVTDVKSEPPRTKGATRYTAPQFMTDLEFDQGTSLRSFADEYKPLSDNEKYLVVAGWFQKHRSTESIGIHHIYTAFQKMSWKSQRDIAQPFRVMMKKKSFFIVGGRGLFKITHIGLDELPKIRDKKA